MELKGGRFSAQKLGTNVDHVGMREALTEYFTKEIPDGSEVYILGTLDTTKHTLLPSMTPSRFKFNILYTESDRDILQLFIATTGYLLKSTHLYLAEPFPTSSESSLIISSKIAYSNIIPESFGKAGVGLEFEPSDPGKVDKAWSTTVTAGVLPCPYNEKMVDNGFWREGIYTHYWKDYVAVEGNSVLLPLKDMRFESNAKEDEWKAKMSHEVKKNKYPFKYGDKVRSCTIFGCDDWSDIRYSNYTLGVEVIMYADLQFDVTGKGQNQQLKLSSVTSTNPIIKGQLEPAGPCKSDNQELQKSFLETLQTEVAPKLKTMLKKDFLSISIFALKNILFPAKNFIDMQEAYIPGDLVVFGKFTVDTS